MHQLYLNESPLKVETSISVVWRTKCRRSETLHVLEDLTEDSKSHRIESHAGSTHAAVDKLDCISPKGSNRTTEQLNYLI